MKPAKLFGILIAGTLFGAGLAISGMTDPARVIGFLDVFGKWDPALVFVMAGAVGTYGIGTLAGRKASHRDALQQEGLKLPTTRSEPIDRRLVIGAAIFGVGWGLSGFCPGPALANLGALRIEALVFVPAMAIGMVAAQRVFGADRGQVGSRK
ncbi:MAG: YeeE/YedE family protein [Verrucomicrobiaceae bacterium]|nr:YeeE/YedE family protein [Verrucomicrobiaceae bacterium]